MPSVHPFTQTSGPNHSLQSSSPADFFELFLDDDVVNLLVTQTNIYADQIIDARRNSGRLKKYSRAKKWRAVTREEMKSFLALMFLMGIIKKPEIAMYWSTDPMLATPFSQSVMTRNRFQAIWSFFHVNDNALREENCQDRLYKVRPLLDELLERFRDLYTPGKELSLDEGMLKWRGRLRFRVYNPMKPTKYGIKSQTRKMATVGT